MMKRVRKRSTGRRAPVATTSTSKISRSKTSTSKSGYKSVSKPVSSKSGSFSTETASPAKTRAVTASSAKPSSAKPSSAKANSAKTRPLKKRAAQVTAETRANKTGFRTAPGSKAQGAARRESATRTPAAGVVEVALAVFAHEVRTPLTGILAISDLLAPSALGERERRWVDTIKAGAEHLASLATLFVDAARSSGPGLAVRRSKQSSRTLARSA